MHFISSLLNNNQRHNKKSVTLYFKFTINIKQVRYAQLLNLDFSDGVLMCVTDNRRARTEVILLGKSHTPPDNMGSILK